MSALRLFYDMNLLDTVALLHGIVLPVHRSSVSGLTRSFTVYSITFT